MEKIISVETMRKSDAWTIAHLVPSKELMRRAGEAIYKNVEWKAPVAIICGKGNNAGDGYVVADLLQEQGIACTIILLEEKFSEDGRYYYDIARAHGVPAVCYDAEMTFTQYACILDCLLGTGFSGTVRGTMAKVIDKINASGAYVVSADINSGLNGDTGTGERYVRSDLTVSIGFFKYGHFRGDADIAMKRKVNCDIGIQLVEE